MRSRALGDHIRDQFRSGSNRAESGNFPAHCGIRPFRRLGSVSHRFAGPDHCDVGKAQCRRRSCLCGHLHSAAASIQDRRFIFRQERPKSIFGCARPQKIGRYIQLRNAKRSRVDKDRNLEDIARALSGNGIAYLGGYDLRSEHFQITVENAEDVSKVESLLPEALKQDTVVMVGPVPKVQAAPYGVSISDTVTGGTTIISGTGIHTAGADSGTNGVSIYMPIDYIDDHLTSVNTVKQ